MEKLFELPELLTLSGEIFNGENAVSGKGTGCEKGCEGGCANGCSAGGGDGKPPFGG